jgi:hypothetical protein
LKGVMVKSEIDVAYTSNMLYPTKCAYG